jgi:hypothetical protein
VRKRLTELARIRNEEAALKEFPKHFFA